MSTLSAEARTIESDLYKLGYHWTVFGGGAAATTAGFMRKAGAWTFILANMDSDSPRIVSRTERVNIEVYPDPAVSDDMREVVASDLATALAEVDAIISTEAEG